MLGENALFWVNDIRRWASDRGVAGGAATDSSVVNMLILCVVADIFAEEGFYFRFFV